MTELSKLDKMLGIQPVASIKDFQSPEARELAVMYDISLAAIPELRKKFRDFGDGRLERLVATNELPSKTLAQVLAAEAMFFYEQAVRAAGFRLVGPEIKEVIVAELYGHVDKVTPNQSRFNYSMAKLFAGKAAAFLPA